MVAVASASACGGDDADDTASSTTTSTSATAEPARLEIVAEGLTYQLDRGSVPAGAVEVTLVNQDGPTPLPQIATLVRLADGMTLDDYRALFDAPDGEIAARKATTLFGGPGAAFGGQRTTVTVELDAGTYAIASFMAGPDRVFNLAKGQLAQLDVTDAEDPSPMPQADQGVEMRDMGYDLPEGGLEAGAVVEVTNAGPQDHELGLLRLNDGATIDDVVAFFSGPPSGPPPFSTAGGVNGLAPGEVNQLTLPEESGRYVLFCALGDVEGGPPHFLQGMVAELQIG